MINRCELLVIGGSAGSLDVLLKILPDLRPELPFAIIIVLHRKSTLNSALADLFANKTTLPVAEVEEKDEILPSTIYIAPADYHLMIESDKSLSLDSSEKINFSRPSIDLTFQTAAEVYKSKLTGLLLSGANTDGTDGLLSIKQFGGVTAVQDPIDATVPFMPQAAMQAVQVDHVLRNNRIAEFINNLNIN